MIRIAILLTFLIAAPGAFALAFADDALLDHNGVVGQPFVFLLKARSGAPPYTFSIDSGKLPAGLVMTRQGLISGIPTANGTFSFWCNLRDVTKSSQREVKFVIGRSDPTPKPSGLDSSLDSLIKPGWTLTFDDEF